MELQKLLTPEHVVLPREAGLVHGLEDRLDWDRVVVE